MLFREFLDSLVQKYLLSDLNDGGNQQNLRERDSSHIFGCKKYTIFLKKFAVCNIRVHNILQLRLIDCTLRLVLYHGFVVKKLRLIFFMHLTFISVVAFAINSFWTSLEISIQLMWPSNGISPF